MRSNHFEQNIIENIKKVHKNDSWRLVKQKMLTWLRETIYRCATAAEAVEAFNEVRLNVK